MSVYPSLCRLSGCLGNTGRSDRPGTVRVRRDDLALLVTEFKRMDAERMAREVAEQIIEGVLAELAQRGAD